MLSKYSSSFKSTTEKMTVSELLAEGKTRIYPTVNSFNSHAKSSSVPVPYNECGLFDNILNNDYSSPNTFYWIYTSCYLDITIDKYTNIYRCGTFSYSHYNYPLTILSIDSDGKETDVTALYTNEYDGMPQLNENEVYLSFISLKPGRYKFKAAKERMDSEWFMYEDKSKEISYFNNTCYLFNETTHIFEEVPMSNSNITADFITANGNGKGVMYSTFNTKIVNVNLIDESSNYTITTSDEINPLWQMLSYTESPLNSNLYTYNFSTKPFIPINELDENYLLYSLYEKPEIIYTELDSTETHNKNILLTTRVRFDFEKKIRLRLRINSDIYTSWSEFISPMSKKELIIPYNKLKIGENDITIEIETDDNKTTTKTLYNAVTLVNGEPTITIINKESNNFKIHFIINDVDSGDLVKYQLTLKNNKIGSKVVIPWTEERVTPYTVKYTFDSSLVDVDKINTLLIEFEDNLGGKASTNYTFLGEYCNLLFSDENGKYYTSDTGALLKMLDFGRLISGSTTDIKKVFIKNNNQEKIYHLVLSAKGINNHSTLELSKNNNPFIATNVISFGDEVVEVGHSREFYVRITTKEEAQGKQEYQIEALADLIL